MKTWAGSYTIPDLVSGITVSLSRNGPSFGGAASLYNISQVDSGAEAMQLRNKGKGILSINVDGMAMVGLGPISPKDTQPQHQPQSLSQTLLMVRYKNVPSCQGY